MTDIYDILAELLDEIKSKIPDYKVSVEKSESVLYNHQIKISDSDYSHSMGLIKYDSLTHEPQKYLDLMSHEVMKFHKRKIKEIFHIKNKVFATQFNHDNRTKILKLAKKVFNGVYDGIEIENSVYGTAQFNMHIVKLARTKSILRSKSEPIVYIPLYEFFTVQLFDKIYGIDDEFHVDTDLANEWTDINAELMKIQSL